MGSSGSGRGFTVASVSSAKGYVEHFCEKNGYRPVEYLVTVPAGVPVQCCGDYGAIDVRDLGE